MEDRQYEHLLREIVASRQYTDEGFARFGAELRAEMRQQGEELRTELRAEMRQQGEELRTELRAEMRQQGDELRTELRAEMHQQGAELRTELRAEMHRQGADLRHELIAYTDTSAAETRRHAAVIAEGLRAELQQVANGVAALDEKTDRRFAEVQERFTETHALIRLSYRDLDRRLKAVEGAGR